MASSASVSPVLISSFPPNTQESIEKALNIARNNNTIDKLEVEARLRLLSPTGAVGVPPAVFYRMKDYLDNKNIPYTETSSRDDIQNEVRRTTYHQPNSQVTWIRKTPQSRFDSEQMGVRISLAMEEVIKPVASFRPTLTRRKKRYSYSLFRRFVRLDMTRVENETGRYISYEIELEWVDKKQIDKRHIQLFMDCVSYVWKWLHGSNMLYTLNDLGVLGETLIRGSGATVDNPLMRFNRDVLVQARNLKREDLVYGGIVGNPDTNYSVTVKADGIRKLLVFTEKGVWAVMPPFEYNLILPYEDRMKPFVGSWFDGELIPMEKRNNQNASPPASPYWFLIFDTLRADNRSVTNMDLGIRLKLATKVATVFAETTATAALCIHAKEFYHFRTTQELFNIMTELGKKIKTLAYHTDGYMFTPYNTPYNSRSHELNMNQRVLVAVPDIVKWKPPEELTIDFAVRRMRDKNGNVYIGLYSSQKGNKTGGVLFRGTPWEQYLGTIKKEDRQMLLDKIEDNTVVEFGWMKGVDGDDTDGRGQFEVRRIRFDKAVGNDLQIAQEVWNDIHNPIPFASLTDEDDDISLSRLVFAIAWEIHKMPVKYTVFPDYFSKRPVTALLNTVRYLLRTRFNMVDRDENDLTSPAVFINTHPSRNSIPDTYFCVQDTRVFPDVPPGVIVDTWTVVQPLLGLTEKSEVPFIRFSHCINKQIPNAYYWPEPLFQERAAKGLERLELFPPHRVVSESSDNDGRRYIVFHPSTWTLYRAVTPPTSVPSEPYESTKSEIKTIPADNVPEHDGEPKKEENTLVENPAELWDAPTYAASNIDIRPDILNGTIETVTFAKYTEYPVVRIGTEGDGSCLIHAILQGYNTTYQSMTTGKERKEYVRRIRTALVDFITLQNPESPGNTFYESAEVSKVFALSNIQEKLRSNDFLGDESYAIIGLCLGVNIYTVRVLGTDIRPELTYIHEKRRQWTVVINGTINHYETMGLQTDQGIQTAFVPEDPFLRTLINSTD